MDPLLIIVLIIFLVLALFAIWQAQNAKRDIPDDVTMPPDEYEFDDDSESAIRTTPRKIKITAPPQRREGKRQRIRVQPQPLPNVQELVIPQGKNLDALITTVLNPRVYFADSGQEINTFTPPLTLHVTYKKQDADATTTSDGVPQLSIVTGYRTAEGWKLERLATTVTPDEKTGGGTCTADVSTLQPADPIFLFRP